MIAYERSCLRPSNIDKMIVAFRVEQAIANRRADHSFIPEGAESANTNRRTVHALIPEEGESASVLYQFLSASASRSYSFHRSLLPLVCAARIMHQSRALANSAETLNKHMCA